MSTQTIEKEVRVLDEPGKSFPLGKILSYAVLIVVSILYIGPLFMLVNASFKPLS